MYKKTLKIILEVFSALSAVSSVIFIFIPTNIDIKGKIIVILSIAVVIFFLFFILYFFESKGLEKRLNETSQKHRAICKQFDKKSELLTTYQSLLYNLKMTSDTAKEKNKDKRYEYVYSQIEFFVAQIKLMEEDGNDKQK